ncbi:MAG: ATP-binding protein [Spirochaetales bacterium]|nr:ATP-binding protein [Spirochaetales bacterium]
MGFDYETSTEFWHRVLKAYLNTTCEAKVREVEDKARIIGYTRLIRRHIRRGGLETPEGKAEISFWKQKLISLIDNTDNLTFSLDELETDASTERLADVQQFISEKLERADCPMKVCMQIEVAVEEIFVNIASYAYAPLSGKAKVRVELSDNPSSVSITFIDHGVPYNPLAKVDPDVHAEASDRPIGGLGIYMTKKMMDDVTYEYKDGENILTLKKNL